MKELLRYAIYNAANLEGKKFKAMLGAIAVLTIGYIGSSWHEEIKNWALDVSKILGFYILGQGAADFGKNAKKEP